MKNNINKKIGATLLSAAIMAGTAVIPMSNAAVEAKVNNAPSIKISAHVQDIGWMDPVEAKEGNVVGTFWQSRRVEAMKFDLRNCPGVTLSIVAHVQDHGDMEFTVGAEDYDKLVGTQWEQRRMEAITIKSNGLHEQGYKLQYRAHVQDHGWLTWVEEGEMAGTRWEQRRVEAIEMRIVPMTDAASAILTLKNYDAAIKANAESEEQYETLHASIEASIESIQSAETDQEVADAMEIIRAEIEKAFEDIDKLVAENIERTAEAKAEAKAEIEEYEKAIAQINGLTNSDKAIINQIISDAKKAVDESVIPAEVNAASANLDELIETSYSNVALLKTQNQAIEELSSYLADATTGIRNVINASIEDIKEATTINAITNDNKNGILDTALTTIAPLKTAQKEAIAELQLYRDAVNTSSETNKAILRNIISDVESNVKNAKSETEVSNTMDAFRSDFEKFEETVGTTLFEDAIADAIKTISAYLTYTDDANNTEKDYVTVKDTAQGYIDALNELKEAGYDKTERNAAKVKELVGEMPEEDDQIPSDATKYILVLEGKVRATKLSEEENRRLYREAYAVAVEKLDKYSEIAKEVITDAEELNGLNNLIAQTKNKIKEVSDAPSVEAAVELVDNYMEKYCGEESVNEVNAALKKQAIENAEKSLLEYTTKSYLKVDVNNKIAEIKAMSTDSSADYKVVNEALKVAKEEFDLRIAKYDATVKLLDYYGNDTIPEDKSLGVKDNGDGISVGEYAKAQVEAIDGMDNVSDVNAALRLAVLKINTALGKEEQTEGEALKQARTEATEVVDSYITLARELGKTSLVNSLTGYKEAITAAKTVEAVEAIVADNVNTVDNVIYYVKTYHEVFNAQYNAINTILEQYLEDYKEDADLAKVQSIVTKARADIKALKLEKDETEQECIERILAKVEEDISALQAKIDALDAYKDDNKLAVIKAVTKNDSATLETEVDLPVQIYLQKIDVISLDDCTITLNENTQKYEVTKCAKMTTIISEVNAKFGTTIGK